MSAFLLGLVTGAGLAWVFVPSRDGYWRESNARRRGSNPPAPGSKPARPVGPPPPDLLPMPPAPPWEEGHTQRGNGNGGPTTPKPPIKPQPSGGHQIREGQLWGGYQPRPQSGTPSPPPEAP